MAISHGASHRMHDAVKKREQKNNNLVKTYTDVADLTTTKQHLPQVHRSFLCLVQYLKLVPAPVNRQVSGINSSVS